jgi:DnaJ-class molecular chaperone
MNHHAILGVANNATKEEIVNAYRKLAMLHHPDRGGDQEMFKMVKASYEALEKTCFRPHIAPRTPPRPEWTPHWTKPQNPGGTWRDRDDIGSIFEDLKAANRGAAPGRRDYTYAQPDGELVVRVSLREAFAGFNMNLQRHRNGGMFDMVPLAIPPGLPDGHRRKYRLSDGSTQTVIVRINTGDFHLRGFVGTDNLFNVGLMVGDMELEMDIDAIDLITGAWVKVTDFLGEELNVRVPAGFNPLQRLKVANKGYAGWSEEYNNPTTTRRDLYIRLRPIFKKPADIDRQKILNLYNAAVGNNGNPSEVG